MLEMLVGPFSPQIFVVRKIAGELIVVALYPSRNLEPLGELHERIFPLYSWKCDP